MENDRVRAILGNSADQSSSFSRLSNRSNSYSMIKRHDKDTLFLSPE
jgi:hypothetical protein